jgi:hypothetical protein
LGLSEPISIEAETAIGKLKINKFLGTDLILEELDNQEVNIVFLDAQTYFLWNT